MLSAIQAFANGVAVTPVDPSLVVSRALTLYAGTVASGNNRFDGDIIARWMFKEGTGTTAFDTSGVDPAINLTISGNTSWDSAWGLIFGTGGAKAQGSTATSSKIYNSIANNGQYSLELWAAPANVTQTAAFMGGYSGGASLRNFTLAQDAMQYQAYGRSTVTDSNGAPPLTTAAANMNAQAALQHRCSHTTRRMAASYSSTGSSPATSIRPRAVRSATGTIPLPSCSATRPRTIVPGRVRSALPPSTTRR
jgi:hypothetical protein